MGGGRKVNDEQHGNTACGLKIHWLSLMERKATCDMTRLMEREKERQSPDYREDCLDLSGRDWRRDLQ